MLDVDALAQEIRRVDGNHDHGAGALAQALMPFLSRALVATPPAEPVVEADAEPANCISFDTKDRLVGALRTAIDHIEHMSAFLSKLQAGYSFEGIGEDMPNLRDALASATSSDVTKYPAGVSSRDHIAHDMKIGRFPRQSSIDTFLRERALTAKPAVKDDETVVEALREELRFYASTEPIADVVLRYKPKPISAAAKKRKRAKRKVEKTRD